MAISKSITEKPVDQNPLWAVPADVWVAKIFSQIDRKDLCRASQVCKNWYAWTSNEALWRQFDIHAVFPQIKIEYMDTEFWKNRVNFVGLEAMGINLSKVPGISKRQIIAVLARINGDARATIVTMPKGHSTKKLIALMENYMAGESFTMDSLDGAFKPIEDTHVRTPYTFVAVSEYKKYESTYFKEVYEKVEEHKLKLAYLLELATLNFFRAISSNNAHYVSPVICTERGPGPFENGSTFHQMADVSSKSLPHRIHLSHASDPEKSEFFGVKRFYPPNQPENLWKENINFHRVHPAQSKIGFCPWGPSEHADPKIAFWPGPGVRANPGRVFWL